MHTAIPCCTINGEQPALRGQVCQSLLIQEWWWEGRPADPVNVVYLQFEQRWYRLYFEGETVFWRSGEAPRPCENDEGPGEYRLHDLGRQRGLIGVRLLALEFVLNGPTLDSHFDFADGQRLSFRHFLDDDLTRVL
ncbi:hypothetical protein [Pseudomonas aeruginosa]|uniref:hypothetical protein n=1 Tax=Pseudomonas aeruginosa TaxID=287 RepID=UPI00148B40A6|nr:hypothetical protein [Pseudomonas aeruginosa]